VVVVVVVVDGCWYCDVVVVVVVVLLVLRPTQVVWGEVLKHEKLSFPRNANEIPDIFVYIVDRDDRCGGAMMVTLTMWLRSAVDRPHSDALHCDAGAYPSAASVRRMSSTRSGVASRGGLI
jgi:hypothetical protein